MKKINSTFGVQSKQDKVIFRLLYCMLPNTSNPVKSIFTLHNIHFIFDLTFNCTIFYLSIKQTGP